jgi:RNA polymerase sigma-70 factor (ECF subfamily)
MPTLCVNRRTLYLSFIRTSPTIQLTHAAENTQLSYLTVIWQAACILLSGPGGTDKMQATESYIGSEKRLDVRILEKETREMQDVLSRYLPSFYKRAYRYLGNAANAEDAVQDALLSACKHLDQFKGQAKMSTWLTAIVINCARTQLRRRPHQPHLSLDEQLGEDQKYCVSERLADCRPSPEDVCIGSDLHGRLMQFVAELSPSLRKAYQLRDLNGLTTSEAAQILGVTEGTLKAQLSRARAELRRLMRLALKAQPRSDLTYTASPVVARK